MYNETINKHCKLNLFGEFLLRFKKTQILKFPSYSRALPRFKEEEEEED